MSNSKRVDQLTQIGTLTKGDLLAVYDSSAGLLKYVPISEAKELLLSINQINNNTAARGFLPYGSNDNSVILRSSLLSAANITTPEIGSAGSVVGSPTFDSIKGMYGTSTSAARWQNLTGYEKLWDSCQISFEIETTALGIEAAAVSPNYTESDGGSHAANEYVCMFHPTGGSNDWIALYNQTNSTLGYYTRTNANAQITGKGTTTVGKPIFSTVNINVDGDVVDYYIDGVLMNSHDRSAYSQNTSIFQDIIIGNSNGFNNGIGDFYIRNLQIANKPVSLPVIDALSNVIGFGDSFIVKGSLTNEAYRFDGRLAIQLKKRLAKIGLGLTYTDEGHSGFSVSASATSTLDDHYADVAAQNPTVVIYWAGTNDTLGTLYGDFQTSLQTQIDAFTALDSCQLVLIANIPGFACLTAYENEPYLTYVTTVNTAISAVVSGDTTGKVHLVDIFTEWGGATADDGYMVGTTDPSSTDYHPSALGHISAGNLFFDKLMEQLA